MASVRAGSLVRVMLVFRAGRIQRWLGREAVGKSGGLFEGWRVASAS